MNGPTAKVKYKPTTPAKAKRTTEPEKTSLGVSRPDGHKLFIHAIISAFVIKIIVNHVSA
jgi:hypothetical protein